MGSAAAAVLMPTPYTPSVHLWQKGLMRSTLGLDSNTDDFWLGGSNLEF